MLISAFFITDVLYKLVKYKVYLRSHHLSTTTFLQTKKNTLKNENWCK